MASSRRARGAAVQQAKERRQKVIVAGGAVLLLLLLAIQLPKLMSRGGSSSSTASSVSSEPVTPAAVADTSATSTLAYRAALKQAPHDVFSARQLSADDTLGAVPTPAGLHDPFAKPHSAQAAIAPALQKPVSASPLPGTIIIGTPGAGKVTVQGWIVILASIPTAQGAVAANSFADQARKSGLGKVSVLNSSTKKPLRGGYWVVYTGPYNTLAQVSAAADTIHRSGFKTAYIRQLVMYSAKPAAHKAKTKKTATKK